MAAQSPGLQTFSPDMSGSAECPLSYLHYRTHGRFVISVVAFWQLVWQSEGTLREC
ncbi:hypothetical protein T4A_12234 [Trichinella pseudospiralis]|uniref:Uncharacterized protein n=1 Tax=Trichinella pseudospiralis TaxID=6337 RepID=A0A0V1J9K3_TRIPS|nr:hypothetical protein T4A_12234 [Trichinella pseudospiralis]KRZ31285.1 hypothetical protein T4C_8584 [Trichinella pseudospiralis]